MQCVRSFSFDSIAPRGRAWPGAASPALGLALGLAGMGCRFEPAAQGPDDPDPTVDAAQPRDGRQPVDAGSAPGPDAPPEVPEDGGAGKPTLPAYLIEADGSEADIQIDGNLDDWDEEGWQELEAPADYHPDADPNSADASDISVRFAARWHPDLGLYLAFDITDNVHAIDNGNSDQLWRGDSVQAGFDVGQNSGPAYDTIDDFEYGWALAGNFQEREYRWVQSAGAPSPDTDVKIIRTGTKTIYEVRMPPRNLNLDRFMLGQRLGFSVMVNDEDIGNGGNLRDGWLEWTEGIAPEAKRPDLFGVLELRGELD